MSAVAPTRHTGGVPRRYGDPWRVHPRQGSGPRASAVGDQYRSWPGSSESPRLPEHRHFAWEQAAEEYGRLVVDWVSGGYRRVAAD